MTFRYNGLVQIRTRNKLHIIHNRGSQDLFNTIAEFLVGNTTRMTDMKTIQIFRGKAEDLLRSTTSYIDVMVSHKIPLKSQQTQLLDDDTLKIMGLPKGTNIYGATFYTTIKPEYLVETSAQNSQYSVGLFSGSTLLAVIDLDWQVYSNVCEGGRADVKWTMALSNTIVEQGVKE